MPHNKLNRESFDAFISAVILNIKKNEEKLAKTKLETERLKRIEDFYRGLMRTHTYLPKKNYFPLELTEDEKVYIVDGKDMRPQFFFQDQQGRPVLIIEFNPPSPEKYLKEMKRIPASEAQSVPTEKRKKTVIVGTERRKIINTNRGKAFIIFISPYHDTGKGHNRFIVDFDKMTSRPFVKKKPR